MTKIDSELSTTSENAVQNKVITSALTLKQGTSNLVTSISSSSTNSQYPSAKCLYDTLGGMNIEEAVSRIANIYYDVKVCGFEDYTSEGFSLKVYVDDVLVNEFHELYSDTYILATNSKAGSNIKLVWEDTSVEPNVSVQFTNNRSIMPRVKNEGKVFCQFALQGSMNILVDEYFEVYPLLFKIDPGITAVIMNGVDYIQDVVDGEVYLPINTQYNYRDSDKYNLLTMEAPGYTVGRIYDPYVYIGGTFNLSTGVYIETLARSYMGSTTQTYASYANFISGGSFTLVVPELSPYS